MEYSFTNISGTRYAIVLEEYGFTFHETDRQRSISYASVVELRMCKGSGGEYRLIVLTDNDGAVGVSSISHNGPHEKIDQAKAYTLFVRVLHHHLKEKGHTVFTCGGTKDGLWKGIGTVIVVSLILSIGLNFWGFSLVNPYLQAVFLVPLLFGAALMIRLVEFPKNYDPADIPIQFLP